MKVLVFSDSHRSRSGMLNAVALHQPDQIIHLGDLLEDAEELSYVYPQIPICMVPGNCDGWTMQPLKRQITLCGKQILLSHGHLWGVKRNYQAAIAEAHACGADILLFGHTHVPYCEHLEDGLWVLNPGPSFASYGLILLDDSGISCSLQRTE